MTTVIDLFESCAKKYADLPYLLEKEKSAFKPLTYHQTHEQVMQFAAGLLSIGINIGDRVSLLSEGRNNWVISELGLLYIGAINVPLSVKLNEQEIKFRVEHSGSRLFLTTSRQIEKINAIRKDLNQLETIILIDNSGKKEEGDYYFDEIIHLGKLYLEQNKEAFEDRIKQIKPDSDANICYTSGTTAEPKGIILTHRNYTANVEQSLSVVTVEKGTSTLLILPWDHAFAHTCGVYAVMASGASIASVEMGKTPMETLKNIPKNIKEVKPSFLLSVPALAKNFRKNIEKSIREKGKFAEKLFNQALKVAYKYNDHGFNRGKGLKFIYKPLYYLYDKILFSKVREGFGGNLNFFVGGGALLDIELQRFFYAIGIPMFQGYGLSEAAPVISANSFKNHKLGSSGKIVDNLELKICDDDSNRLPVEEKGEIVIKGENVMKGYWKNEDATNETLKDGWLYTGDLGYLDNDGYLYVLGRFKSLLIGDDGEKFSPEGIEEAFTENTKYFEQIMLYNNQNPYTVALLHVNIEAIKRYLKEHKIDLDSDEAVNKALQIIEHEVFKYRKNGEFEDHFPQRWLPAAIGILPEGFTEANNLMNSTMKIVRDKITEAYMDKIKFLYSPEGKIIFNHQNKQVIKQLLS